MQPGRGAAPSVTQPCDAHHANPVPLSPFSLPVYPYVLLSPAVQVSDDSRVLQRIMKKGAQNSWPGIALVLFCVFSLGLEMGVAWRIRSSGPLLPAARPGLARISGVRFTIADFDGDWKPDLALVETASLHRLQADYAIHLQFSGTASEISFLVSAPSGGIQVAARDVNGDNLPDLIVSSASDERVVAVLLNQGHGRFSRAEPDSYLLAKEPEVFWRSAEQSLGDKFSVAPLRYSFDGERVSAAMVLALPNCDAVTFEGMLAPSHAELHARPGRSPPDGVTLA